MTLIRFRNQNVWVSQVCDTYTFWTYKCHKSVTSKSTRLRRPTKPLKITRRWFFRGAAWRRLEPLKTTSRWFFRGVAWWRCHKSVTLIRVERISVTSLWHLYVFAIKTFKCHRSVALIRFKRIQSRALKHHRLVIFKGLVGLLKRVLLLVTDLWPLRFERISVTNLWHLYAFCNQNVQVSQVCDTYTFSTYKCHKSVTLIRFCNQNV